ncbi:ArnT family glycosyltransferase [Nanoarchaeota archaeon]
MEPIEKNDEDVENKSNLLNSSTNVISTHSDSPKEDKKEVPHQTEKQDYNNKTDEDHHTHRKKDIEQKVISFLKNKYNLAFLIVLSLAILFRLKYFNMDSIWNDAAVHLWYSIKAAKDPSFLLNFTYWRGDYGLPQTITAFFYLFTKNVFLSGKLMALTYSALGITLIYLLGTELKNKFTGLMAAILLGTNHLFYFYSIRPLGDSPVLVSILFILYSMVKFEKEKSIKWGVIAGCSFIITLMHKTQSVLFIIGLVLYYVFFKRKKALTDKATLISWLIPVGTIVSGHLLAKVITGQNLIGKVFSLMLHLRGMPFGFEAAGMLKWITTGYLIPLIVIGILLIVLYKDKKYYALLILGVYYWFYFELNVDRTQDRYMLPLLPFAILLALFALNEIGSYISLLIPKRVRKLNLHYILIFSVVLLIAWNFYTIADPLAYNKSFSYRGHPEAGEWLKENMPEDAILFAGSPRMMRAFAEIEYYSGGHKNSPILGGSLWWLRHNRYLEQYNPKTARANFEEDLANLTKKHDIYLTIDIWEYTQPKWYWPISQESINYFQGKGFKIVNIIERETLTQSGLQKMPVIFIFKKDRVTEDILSSTKES